MCSSVSIKIGREKLVAVVGAVGCGKSSLVSALLGEMIKHEGQVNVQVGGCCINGQEVSILFYIFLLLLRTKEFEEYTERICKMHT